MGPRIGEAVMKKGVYAIFLILVLVPIAVYTIDLNEDLDRYEIGTGTVTIHPGNVGLSFPIRAYNDTFETSVQSLIAGGYEEQEARQKHQNESESEWFQGYNDTWSYYDEYGWEVTLVSGNGTWDVLWLDYENAVSMNNVGFNSSMYYYPTSELTHRGMTKTGLMGPVEKPLQTCTGDPDNNWFTHLGTFAIQCEPWIPHYDIYIFVIVNTGASEIELEWSVYGWK